METNTARRPLMTDQQRAQIIAEAKQIRQAAYQHLLDRADTLEPTEADWRKNPDDYYERRSRAADLRQRAYDQYPDIADDWDNQ